MRSSTPPKDRTVALAVVAVLLLSSTLVAVPFAAASHDVPVLGDGFARTSEPDGAVFNAPGNPLDGKENRVVASGDEPGTGVLFLDARTGQRLGTNAGGVDFFAGHLTAEVLGQPNLILPYVKHTLAWYGWWDDRADFGVINDLHDRACGETRCDGDEFRWRGRATGETVGMMHYTIPRNQSMTSEESGLGPSASAPRDFPAMHALQDETDSPHQVWSGAFTYSADAGLLVTVHSLVIAGAKPAGGSRLQYDFDDPDALWDVDVHEAVGHDVEALWTAVAWSLPDPIETSFHVLAVADSTAAGAIRFAADAILEHAGPRVNDTYAIVEPVVALVPTEEVLDVVERGRIAAENARDFVLASTRTLPGVDTLSPHQGKEPNTFWDDFEDRALFGHRDLWGSGNSYPGYEHGYGFYFDNYARSTACAGAYASASGLSPSFAITCNYRSEDVFGVIGPGQRTAGTMLNFQAQVLLWRDLNDDTHVGAVCNPGNPDEFDAEANTCRSHRHPARWPHTTTSEVVSACEASDVKGSVITLTPVGGPWPGVIVLRDHKQSTRFVFDDRHEVRTDDEPIELRYDDVCGGSVVLSRDAVLFPTPSPVPIRVEAQASIKGFKDGDLEIDVGRQSVVDVDVLPAAF